MRGLRRIPWANKDNNKDMGDTGRDWDVIIVMTSSRLLMYVTLSLLTHSSTLADDINICVTIITSIIAGIGCWHY